MHEAELDLAEALAAEVGRQVGGPQAALLDLLLQRRDRALEALLAEILEHGLDRPDLLAHEVAHPVELLLELGLRREVPRHRLPPPRVAGPQGWQESSATSAPSAQLSASMKPLAALIALLALALGAAPAAAEQRLAAEAAPFTADAYGGVVAWSSYDAAATGLSPAPAASAAQPVDAGRRRLPRPVRPRRRPRPGRRAAGRLLAARRHLPVRPRDRARAAAGRGQHARHGAAPEHPPQRARVRPPGQRPPRPLPPRRAGTRERQPRPRFKRTLAIEDVELSARGLFVVYRTDVVHTCCTRATLYRVAGRRLRHVFAVGSGGANFGQLVTPNVSGRSVYFARTNDGSGQGNRFFRYDLRTQRLFAARGTSRAQSVTWLGDRFLLSRTSSGCAGPPLRDPTATPTCELVLTDPIAFRRASKADRRRTRPEPVEIDTRAWWAPSRSRQASPCSRARRCSRRPASASRSSPRRCCSPPPSPSRRSGC